MTEESQSLLQLAFQKYKRNFWGVFSFFIIFIIGLVALFCYVLAPDNTKHANQMHLSIHSKPPGFKVKMLSLPLGVDTNQSKIKSWLIGKDASINEIPISSYSSTKDSIIYKEYASKGIEGQTKRISKQQLNGLSISEVIPQKTFLLGTDKYGRDLLSRVLVGSRISFSIGFIAVFIALIIGLIMGSLSGYFGGKIDAAIMWLINVSWSIPTLLLVIAVTLALGKGFWQVFIAVGLTMWVEVARVVRGQILSEKEKQYVTAARALGFTDFRIIVKHILPNTMAPVIVICAANFAAAILIESGLSFLGIGAQPPMASWGAIIKDHYNYIILGKPYLALVPGFCIMLLVMAFMLMSNALRDALDVKG